MDWTYGSWQHPKPHYGPNCKFSIRKFGATRVERNTLRLSDEYRAMIFSMVLSELHSTQARYFLDRPQVLVVACSDGRLQCAVDEFLNEGLGISEYDRLMVPGGPGALAGHGFEYSRRDRMMGEMQFLIEAHGIRKLILMFHGPAEDGPEIAVCADYARARNTVDPARIRAAQEHDAQQLLREFAAFTTVDVSAVWAEVKADLCVQFSQLD